MFICMYISFTTKVLLTLLIVWVMEIAINGRYGRRKRFQGLDFNLLARL
jgi:hypothetical protein